MGTQVKKVRVFYRRRGNNTRWTLRAGAKGRGRILHESLGWDNPRSDEQAEKIIAEVASREGYEIVWPDWEEQ